MLRPFEAIRVEVRREGTKRFALIEAFTVLRPSDGADGQIGFFVKSARLQSSHLARWTRPADGARAAKQDRVVSAAR